MQTVRISATKARNNFFDMLDQVSGGLSVIIEKDKKAVAKVEPISEIGKNKGLVKALDEASKVFVYSKKDNPLRRSGAADFLGKWDI